MKLYYSRRARADLLAISAYLLARRPQGAARVSSAILDTLQNLVAFPNLGRLQDVPQVRKIGIKRYPYLIYYRVDEDADEIVIITIQHAGRARDYSDA